MATITPYETAAGKRYRVRYRKPDSSQTDKRGFRTKKEAELFAAAIEVKKAIGDYIDPSAGRTTVTALGTAWISTRSHLKPSSQAVYESAWRLHVKPKWGDRQVGSIAPSEVQAWIKTLETGGGDSKPKSPTIVRRAHDILAGILDSAVTDRLLPSNPARGTKLPRRVRREHSYLTHEQVSKLAAECGTHRTLVLLIAYTGLRWGEATGLRVQDLDMLRRRVRVEQNAVYVKGAVIVGSPKTHEKRSVPFPRLLSKLLAVACEGKNRSELVFSDPAGEFLITPTTRANSWLDKALVAAGLPKSMTIHDLRHTSASLAIAAGANVKAVQRMLGHASAAMTLDTYADLFDDDLDAVAVALDKAASASVGKMWAKGSATQERQSHQ